jgi:phosphohistidine phosphatase SixA
MVRRSALRLGAGTLLLAAAGGVGSGPALAKHGHGNAPPVAFFPGQIILLRHAEKPADEGDMHLSPAGRARADRLASYIPKTFGSVDAIFASAISKHSARPYETVEPLARRLGLSISDPYADDDFAAMARALLSRPDLAGKSVVVCWHHGKLPKLAAALGAPTGSYPDPWDPAVFDLILRLTYGAGGACHVDRVVEPAWAPASAA